jgi:hypothetical protein
MNQEVRFPITRWPELRPLVELLYLDLPILQCFFPIKNISSYVVISLHVNASGIATPRLLRSSNFSNGWSLAKRN